jgi:parallel beta-helix repeat protein
MRNTLQALLASVASVASVAQSVSVASATISMNPSHHKGGQVVQGGGGDGDPAPVNTVMPQIVGEDFPTSPATTVTLTADVGKWDNTPTSYVCNWHFVGRASLGTSCSSLTLDTSTTGVLGSALEIDVTATNAGGATTITSHWFGPIEATAPAAPFASETVATAPTTLPTEPVNFLQNGHAIFPGCSIPPVSPNTDPAHVWYFDPINGRTKDAGATGHARSPFKDVGAILNNFAGYTGGALFRSTIAPGDTIYIEPGNAANPVGDIGTSTATYSTSDRTTTGAVQWTWIMADPAATSRPILHSILFNAGAAGFVFKGLGVEQFKENGRNPIAVGGGTSHDVIFEDISVSTWLGHSSDPWLPSSYPTSGGSSDGTIVTASPVATSQDPFVNNATAPVNATTINVNTIPPIGFYVWSHGYYRTVVITVASSGIPNGSKVTAVNGLDAAHLVNTRLFISSFTAAGLTALPLGGTVTAVASLPATGDGTTYYVVQPSSTAVQTVYTWSGTAWVSAGTFLPATSTTANAVALVFPADGTHTAHWTGSAWEDRGILNATIAPCDPLADAATGCPSTNYPGASFVVPGCDPKTSPTTGGCPAGTPPAWNGTTRALVNETLSYSDRMLVLPAGYFNSADWGGSASTGIKFSGGLDTVHSIQQPPNLLVGATCFSVKDSMVRNIYNGILLSNTTNSILYNNKVKYTSADGIDVYSDHRIWLIHNWASDPTQVWAHQDAIQLATINGSASTNFYGNAVIENELFQETDPTNYFPRFEQGINTTDNIWNQTYVCCNLVNVTSNGIGISGKYNVVIHNDMLTAAITVGNQRKNADRTAVHSVLANNIGAGIDRDNAVPNFCDPVNGDMDTVESNISIPFLPPGVGSNSNIYCPMGGGAGGSGPRPGVFAGLSSWTPTDFRSNAAGVSSLFTAYHPVDPPGNPAPGWGIPGAVPLASPCIRGTFPATGSCAAGDNGILDLHPNASFPTKPAILGTFAFELNLPQTGSIGDAYVASAVVKCSGQPTSCGPNGTVWQPGLYVRATSSGNYTQWAHTGSFPNPVVPPFNPGIIGRGTNLGAQQPIADHDGKAWSSPPSIGAYENH